MEHHNAQAIWQEALAIIASQINDGTYRIWFQSTVGVGFADDVFVVGVASDFAKDWIETRFHSLISDAVSQVVGDVVQCRIVVSEDAAEEPANGTKADAAGRVDPTITFPGPDDLDVTHEGPAITRHAGARPRPAAGWA